jgi:hypothetical protein
VIDLRELSDDDLAHLAGQVVAERRRRTPGSELPALPVRHRGSGEGWRVQAGRMIATDDVA